MVPSYQLLKKKKKIKFFKTSNRTVAQEMEDHKVVLN